MRGRESATMFVRSFSSLYGSLHKRAWPIAVVICKGLSGPNFSCLPADAAATGAAETLLLVCVSPACLHPSTLQRKEITKLGLSFPLTQQCGETHSSVNCKRRTLRFVVLGYSTYINVRDFFFFPVFEFQLTLLRTARGFTTYAWHRVICPRQTSWSRHRRSVRPAGGQSSHCCCWQRKRRGVQQRRRTRRQHRRRHRRLGRRARP